MAMPVIATMDYSKNAKLGGMPATAASADTCPPSCPLYDNGCYWFAGYYTGQHAARIAQYPGRYKDPDQFLGWLLSLPLGAVWRDRVGGDQIPQPDNRERVDAAHLAQVAKANKRRQARGFGFIHYSMEDAHNRRAVLDGYRSGFTLNASANGLAHAASLKRRYPSLSVVTIARKDYRVKDQTRAGVRFILCPNVWNKEITCIKCQICTVPSRDYVVVFPAHGRGAAKVDVIASSND